MSPPHPIVLVHGAWHGAWCFSALQHALDERGVASYAIDLPGHGSSTLPLGDLYGDATHVIDVLTALPTPPVLVGHSYGGAVITEVAARHPHLVHLVYLAAFALDEGESVIGFLVGQPRVDVALNAAIQPGPAGCTVLDPAQAPRALYGDCPPQVVAAALARLTPQPVATFEQTVTGSPRTALASTYVRCLRDQAVHIVHQDVMAARCGSTVTLDADHSPFLSQAPAVADLLAGLAA